MTEPDSAEYDAIRELRQSAGYELVEERIYVELNRQCIALEQPAGGEQTEFIRGYIKALRTVLTIPEILENELKA